MSSLSHVGAMCTGHGCFFPRSNLGPGATTVLVNGRPVALTGDFYPPHNCGKAVHMGTIAGGSSKVIINGRPCARIGDMISCGSVVAQGSGNVIAGG